MRSLTTIVLVLLAPVALAQTTTVPKGTVWKDTVEIAGPTAIAEGTVTVEPGTRIVFKEGAKLSVGADATLSAKGTAQAPIVLSGEKGGTVSVYHGTLLMEHCDLDELGIPGNQRDNWLTGTPASVTLRDCSLKNCGGIWLNGGKILMTHCDVRDAKGGLRLWGDGTSVEVSDCTFTGSNVSAGSGAQVVFRGNVVIDGTISTWQPKSALIEKNYVHRPVAKGTYGFSGCSGTIRNNVVRGGSWTSAGLGGEITGNVFISLPHAERAKLPGGGDKNCTHEHICGMLADAVVERNIFVDGSYGAIMGIGPRTCTGALIRNNTFDMRGAGWAVYLNHLPKNDPKDIVLRNNLFMRCSRIQSEKPVDDSTKYIDYNLFSATIDRRGRYLKIVMAGKKPGDDGFGKHSIPPADSDAAQPAPADVVVNPDVKFPFSDDDLLSRKHTVDEVLQVYRSAYTPKPGSPAIDAASPEDAKDPMVKDGKPDIGAVEAGK